jgi:hypothetical protein
MVGIRIVEGVWGAGLSQDSNPRGIKAPSNFSVPLRLSWTAVGTVIVLRSTDKTVIEGHTDSYELN